MRSSRQWTRNSASALCHAKFVAKPFNVASIVRAFTPTPFEGQAHFATDLSAPVDVYSEWVDAAGTHTNLQVPVATQSYLIKTSLDHVSQKHKAAESSTTRGARRPTRPISEEHDEDGLPAEDEDY